MNTKRILVSSLLCSALALGGCAESDPLDPAYSGGATLGEGDTEDDGDTGGDPDAGEDDDSGDDDSPGDDDGDEDEDPPYDFPCDPVLTEVSASQESVDDLPPLSIDRASHRHRVQLTPEQVDIGAPGSVVLYPHPDDPASQDHVHYFVVGPTFISPTLNDFILDYDRLIEDGEATVMTAESGGGPFHRHEVTVTCG